MPTLPIEAMVRDLTDNGAKIIRAAFLRSDGTSAKLRASKPFRKIDPTAPGAGFKAYANYVWRMLCFDFVPYRPHNCMPCTAGWDVCMVIKHRYEQRERDGFDNPISRRDLERERLVALDALIKQAESVMPITAQRGAMSWRGLV
jgi:hypothetical protein